MGGYLSTQEDLSEFEGGEYAEKIKNPYNFTQLKVGHGEVIEFPSIRDPKKSYKKIRIICLSDTHTKQSRLKIPDGDILLHCGDFSNYASWTRGRDLSAFNRWLRKLPHSHKVIIAGNHDLYLSASDIQGTKEHLSQGNYLQDESVELMGMKIYGSPWQASRSWRYRANAFCVDPRLVRKKLKEVPDDLDVLLTHCAPYGILDCKGGNKDILRETLKKNAKDTRIWTFP